MLTAAFLLSGCRAKPTGDAIPDLGEEHKKAVAASNELGLKLYRELRGTPGNLVISPYGVSTSLSMLLAGSAGDTRDELFSVLDTSARLEPQFHQAQGEMIRWLAPDERTTRAQDIAFSNALFIQQEHDLLKPFSKFLHDHYRAEPQGVDFIERPATARKVINDWAAEKTRNQIQEVVAPEDITDQTRLVIANAVYFKGAWSSAFDASRTGREDFHVSMDETVQVDMMHQTATFGYVHENGVRVLVMPYRGEEWSMVVVLPDDPDGLDELDEQVGEKELKRWVTDAGDHKVELPVWLPRFRFRIGHDLKPALRAIGITKAFDPAAADFSRLEGKQAVGDRLFVDSVRQQAMIEVNEEGTEAAAVTTSTITTTEKGPRDPPRFRADHPFLFLVRENESGLVLFLGRVVDPTKS
jgi:serpin B